MKKLLTSLLVLCMILCAVSASAAGVGGTEYPNPLQDVRVRQALWYAIDMDAIVDALWNGTVTAANKSLIPEGYWQADGLTEYTYDPEKAKELLAEAGWDGSYTLQAVYYTANLLDTITAIQAFWADVGVNMEFQLLTDNLTALLWTPSADGVHSAVDWDICFAGTNALTLGEFYTRHHSTAANNSTVKPDETLDALIETARVAVSTEDQKAAYDAIQTYENEQVQVIPMFYIPSWIITSSHLDMKGNAVGNDQFAYQKNILDWTIDREDKTMYTDTGAVNALEHPATNPALFWHQEIVFDRLLNADENLVPTDGLLAESYEVSEDGKTISFVIREGIKWHDGEPFTAEDVKWTFEYYPTVPGANTVMTEVINDAKAITVDGNTVTFEFNNAQPNALTIFSQWPILPKHCLETVTPENFSASTFWQAPIGTGPFKVDEVKLGEYTTLVRNTEYFIEGTGNIEKIYMYPSTDAGDENLITNAMAGKIDYAFCKDSAQVQQLQEMDGYTVDTVNVTFTRYAFLNMFERE
ncbi:MAG: ABC transporter substrate-binding protein [Clostridia bacterium]|nr:ABC transporter substrate-binding protein [Clostridia bacterium]